MPGHPRSRLSGTLETQPTATAQPSSGLWHHLAVVYDKSQTGGNQVAFYIDGVLQNPTGSLYASTNTNNFGNSPIYLFTRGGTTEFDSARLLISVSTKAPLTPQQIQQIYKQCGLVTLSVTPGSTSITAGSQQRFTATGTYRDGGKQDLTNSATWTSTTPSVATQAAAALSPGWRRVARQSGRRSQESLASLESA